jgi:flagellar biosynthesis protein FliP
LTLFIMSPVLTDIYTNAVVPYMENGMKFDKALAAAKVIDQSERANAAASLAAFELAEKTAAPTYAELAAVTKERAMRLAEREKIAAGAVLAASCAMASGAHNNSSTGMVFMNRMQKPPKGRAAYPRTSG